MHNKIMELLNYKKNLVIYLMDKLETSDWHGIRDCCVDIEKIESQIEILEGINGNKNL